MSFLSSVVRGMTPSLRSASMSATTHHDDTDIKTAKPPACFRDFSQRALTNATAAAWGLTTAGMLLLKILP